MSFCPNCGGEVGASDRFCRSCGSAVGGQAPVPGTAAPPPADQAQYTPPVEPSPAAAPPVGPPAEPARRGVPLPATRRGRALFVVAVIVLVASAVAIPFALLDDDEGAEQAASSPAAETTETEASGTQDSDSDGISDADDEEPYTAPGDVEPEEPAEPEPEQKYKMVGQSANDGGVKYTLHSLEEVTSVPVTEYSDPIAPRSGAKLVAARIGIKNNGQTPIDPLCGGAEGFVLLDERDRNYKAEDSVLDIQGNDSVCNDGIAPGFRDDFTIVYEIPEDARIGGLVVWNTDDENDYDGQVDQIVFTP